jgi:hypothetical protein
MVNKVSPSITDTVYTVQSLYSKKYNLMMAYIEAETCIRLAQLKVGLINLRKGLFSLNACIYYKLKSGI